jgi:hypothetical protein
MPAGLINRSARRSHELKSAKVHKFKLKKMLQNAIAGAVPTNCRAPPSRLRTAASRKGPKTASFGRSPLRHRVQMASRKMDTFLLRLDLPARLDSNPVLGLAANVGLWPIRRLPGEV